MKKSNYSNKIISGMPLQSYTYYAFREYEEHELEYELSQDETIYILNNGSYLMSLICGVKMQVEKDHAKYFERMKMFKGNKKLDVSNLVSSIYKKLVKARYMRPDCFVIEQANTCDVIYNTICNSISIVNSQMEFEFEKVVLTKGKEGCTQIVFSMENFKAIEINGDIRFDADEIVIAHYQYIEGYDENRQDNNFVLMDNKKTIVIDKKTGEIHGTILYCGRGGNSISVNNGSIVSLRIFKEKEKEKENIFE